MVPDEPATREARKNERFSVSHLKHDLGRRAVSGGVAVLLTQMLSMVLNFGSIAVLSRLITPAEFGVVALVLPVSYLLSEVAQGALGQVTIQRGEITHRQASGVFWSNALIGLGLGSLTVAISPLVVLFYEDPRLYPILNALAASVLLAALNSQFSAILVRQMRYGSLRTTQLSAEALAAAAAIAAAWIGFSYWAIVIQVVCRQLFRLVFCIVASGWMPDGVRSLTAARGLLGVGGYLAGFSILTQLGHGLGTIIVGRAFGELQAGLFSRAWGISSLPTSQIIGPLGNVFIPVLSQVAADARRASGVFARLFANVAVHSTPMAVIAFVGADDITSILLGPDWMAAADFLRAFSILMVSMPIASTINWQCIASGRTQVLFQYALVSLPLIVAGLVIALPYGAVALAYVHALGGLLVRLPILALISWKGGVPLPVKTVALYTGVAAAAFGAELALASVLMDLLPSVNAPVDLVVLTLVVASLHAVVALAIPATRREAAHLLGVGLKRLPLFSRRSRP